MQGGKIIIAFWSPECCQFYKHWNFASAFFISLMALGEAMPTVRLFILLDLLVLFIFLSFVVGFGGNKLQINEFNPIHRNTCKMQMMNNCIYILPQNPSNLLTLSILALRINQQACPVAVVMGF